MRRVCLALLALTGAAHGFIRSTVPGTDMPLRWTNNCLSFYVHSAGFEGLPFDAVEVEVVRSAQQWMLPACTDLQLRYRGVTNDDRVGFLRDEPNRNVVVWRDGRTPQDDWVHDRRVLALTTNTYCTEVSDACPFIGAVLDADIEINTRIFTFTNDAVSPVPAVCQAPEDATSFDLGNTLTHEFGHFIGLDHTTDAHATMFAESLPGERCKRDLAEDDARGVCFMFPADGEGRACNQLRPPSPPNDCATAPGTGVGARWLLGLLGLCYRRRR